MTFKWHGCCITNSHKLSIFKKKTNKNPKHRNNWLILLKWLFKWGHSGPLSCSKCENINSMNCHPDALALNVCFLHGMHGVRSALYSQRHWIPNLLKSILICFQIEFRRQRSAALSSSLCVCACFGFFSLLSFSRIVHLTALQIQLK